MSFLNQLKSEARSLQERQGQRAADLHLCVAETEAAGKVVLHYFEDLVRQLNVIAPAAPPLTLDGKVFWPAMKLAGFRVDARRKSLGAMEVMDYIAMGWNIVSPADALPMGSVSVNFPPDLQRVEARLSCGMVAHERKELRHPVKGGLQAIRFDYTHASRGNVTVAPDHEAGLMRFRLVNVNGFGIDQVVVPAARIDSTLLDELAKRIVSRDNSFA